MLQNNPSSYVAGSYIRKASVEVFPVPAGDELTCKFFNSINGKLKVFDISGQMIYEKTISEADLKIETSAWTNGIYTLQFISSQNTAVRKIIISQRP